MGVDATEITGSEGTVLAVGIRGRFIGVKYFPSVSLCGFHSKHAIFFKHSERKVGINLGHLGRLASPLFPSLVREHSEMTKVSACYLPVLSTIPCQLHLKPILSESCRHVKWGFS